jgi:hypothetical protein
MDATFIDAKGRSWELVIDQLALHRIIGAGILEPGTEPGEIFKERPLHVDRFIALLFAICSIQANERDVSCGDFCESVPIEEANIALKVAIKRFEQSLLPPAGEPTPDTEVSKA